MKFTRRTILKALAAAILAPGLPFTRLLVCEGNSITATWSGFKMWPDQIVAEPYMQSFQVINAAVGGSNIISLEQRAEKVDGYIGLAHENYLACFEITNSLMYGLGVQETFNRHVSYCMARRKAGYKVLIGTGISRNNEPHYHIPNGYTWEDMLQINQMIRSSYTQYADGLLDFAAAPELGTENAWSNPAIFWDQVHPTDEGSRLMKNVVLLQLQHMISAPLYIPFFAANA